MDLRYLDAVRQRRVNTGDLVDDFPDFFGLRGRNEQRRFGGRSGLIP